MKTLGGSGQASRAPRAPSDAPAPMLGEHTEEVIAEWLEAGNEKRTAAAI